MKELIDFLTNLGDYIFPASNVSFIKFANVWDIDFLILKFKVFFQWAIGYLLFKEEFDQVFFSYFDPW